MSVLIKNKTCDSFACLTDDARQRIHEKMAQLDDILRSWKNIAKENQIDISEEVGALKWLKKDFQQIQERSPEELNLVRLQKAKQCLAGKIIRKVRRNIEISLIQSLAKLTIDYMLPWLSKASLEGVDFQEERSMVVYALINEMELFKWAKPFQREVILRRQLLTRQLAVTSIIRKVFAARINHLANEMKEKGKLDDARFEEIEGIRREALDHLPSSSKPEVLLQASESHYALYRANLVLLENFPKVYARLADKEWMKREIDRRASILSGKIKKIPHLTQQLNEVLRYAHFMLKSEGNLEAKRKQINRAFDLIEERVVSISQSCGTIFNK